MQNRQYDNPFIPKNEKNTVGETPEEFSANLFVDRLIMQRISHNLGKRLFYHEEEILSQTFTPRFIPAIGGLYVLRYFRTEKQRKHLFPDRSFDLIPAEQLIRGGFQRREAFVEDLFLFRREGNLRLLSGYGIPDLFHQNDSLRYIELHDLFNRHCIPPLSFPILSYTAP